jgi:hypothetical protein
MPVKTSHTSLSVTPFWHKASWTASPSYTQCALWCPKTVPIGGLEEFANRVSVGFGPTMCDDGGVRCSSLKRNSKKVKRMKGFRFSG